jgi:hypothetical protein
MSCLPASSSPLFSGISAWWMPKKYVSSCYIFFPSGEGASPVLLFTGKRCPYRYVCALCNRPQKVKDEPEKMPCRTSPASKPAAVDTMTRDAKHSVFWWRWRRRSDDVAFEWTCGSAFPCHQHSLLTLVPPAGLGFASCPFQRLNFSAHFPILE